jgi:signal transduction histidine kinase
VELEGRVAQKHAELQHNFAQLRELERQQAIAEERQRIMSDMHDGIGGQLISALSLVEAGNTPKEQVAVALRECIDDLRLAIDSLEPTEEDLLPVLGSLRYRLEPRLKAQGIALDWQVQEVPKLACLTPQNVLHILRILQEAFTNVLKHAQADRIAVEAGVEPDSRRVYIRVSDNGRGLASSDGPRPQGHGLVNMLRRAKALGGELLVRPSSGRGTTLELLLPVG